jgi:hypothetical protein
MPDQRVRLAFTLSTALLFGCPSEGEIRLPFDEYPSANPQDVETPIQIDRVVQTTIPSMDVLFVVDNSCSMSEEQASLGTNFPAMLNWFLGSGLDYHIGVVSTDMFDPLESGRLRVAQGASWIDETTEEPEAVFAEMVQMGTDGHWEEKGRAATYTAVELLAGGENLGFVREEAGMHITVVSDENDDSGDSPITRDEFIRFLKDYRWSERMVSFSSIVGPLTGCPYIGSPGTEYTAVTSAVGGVEWPICSEDWTSVLDQLGFIATGLSREFFLSRRPVQDTLQVRVIDPAGTVFEFGSDTDWTYSDVRNSILFATYVPDTLSVVEIEYEVLSSAEGFGAVTEEEPPE